MSTLPQRTARDWIVWATVGVAALGAGVLVWACVTGWGGIVHGHPTYAAVLVITLLGCVTLALVALRRKERGRGRLRIIGRIVVLLTALVWVGAVAWLRPYPAAEPALSAMRSDVSVTVTESPTEIVMAPTAASDTSGVLFQPGALVDPRAYAAVLRPLAENGHTVVIAKQPLGIAFLATGALDAARLEHPEVVGWLVGGHSLGGTVAALQADGADSDTASPAVGLLLFASYPASDISSSLTVPATSISGTRDGLATPAEIKASRDTLPPDTLFTVIEGASHAQFGDYGKQPGDGVPEIAQGEARRLISDASVAFAASLTPASTP